MSKFNISDIKQCINHYFLRIVYWLFLMLRFLGSVQKFDRILLVHTRGIGDFILLTAVLRQIRRIFEKRSIVVVIRSETKPIAEVCSSIDDVITVNYEKYQYNILYRLQVLYGLSKGSYAVAYNLVYSNDDFAHQLTILSFAKRKYGAYISDIEKMRYEKYYSRLFKLDNDISEVYRNALFFRKLGCSIQNTATTKIWFKKEDEIGFQQVKNKYNLKEEDYIVLSPGARYSIRLWETKKWVSLVKRLHEIYGTLIVFCGKDNDRKIIKEIIGGLDWDKRIMNLAGETDLRLLAKIIENALLFVGVESASIHIAAAMGTPNVCLMGGGYFNRFFPYGNLERNRTVYHKMDCFGCNWYCVRDKAKCIQDILVEEVLRAVKDLMENE